jgi:hypothetical protein
MHSGKGTHCRLQFIIFGRRAKLAVTRWSSLVSCFWPIAGLSGHRLLVYSHPVLVPDVTGTMKKGRSVRPLVIRPALIRRCAPHRRWGTSRAYQKPVIIQGIGCSIESSPLLPMASSPQLPRLHPCTHNSHQLLKFLVGVSRGRDGWRGRTLRQRGG